MPWFAHRILNLTALALALTAGPAVAQDNFDANKTPAQLFANDCSGCHKSPTGLIKSSGLFGVESFLREHYTASRQAAAAIAGYLRAVDAEQSAAPA
jgi:mono/diheme cytochrome c family protein